MRQGRAYGVEQGHGILKYFVKEVLDSHCVYYLIPAHCRRNHEIIVGNPGDAEAKHKSTGRGGMYTACQRFHLLIQQRFEITLSHHQAKKEIIYILK